MQLLADRDLLFHLAVAVGAGLLSATVCPRLLGRSLRKRGLVDSGKFRRVGACILMGAVIPIGILLFFGMMQPIVVLPGLAGAVLLFVFVGMKPRLPVWGAHSGVILLCNLIYLTAFMGGLNRCRVLGKRTIDCSKLRAIRIGLAMYMEEQGVFPDDLRQLVDANHLSPYDLLPAFATAPRLLPKSEPYSGPCEFEYVRLPPDAPESLVWVWESTKYHDGEGAWVLYVSGEVRWESPEKLRDDVKRAEDWLQERQRESLSRPTTHPSSQDSSS
jgi:hypothetical protein